MLAAGNVSRKLRMLAVMASASAVAKVNRSYLLVKERISTKTSRLSCLFVEGLQRANVGFKVVNGVCQRGDVDRHDRVYVG